MLDLLSGGRLELGIGSGGTPSSYPAFGERFEDRHDRYARKLVTLRETWAGAELAGGNRLYPVAEGLRARNWQATFSPRGAELAGRDGDGLMLSRTQPRPPGQPDLPLDEIQLPIVEAYLNALPAGVAPRILASRSVFVGDDRDQALGFTETGLRRIEEKFKAAGHEVTGSDLAALIRAFDTHVGTVEDVTTSLAADRTLEDVTDVVVQVHSVDPPHPYILRSLDLFANGVAPALGWTAPEARHAAAAAF